MEHPKSRKEAKVLGAKHYFTGVPCKHGHVALRKTKGACVECIKDEWQASAARRAEYFAAYNKSEQGKENKRTYYDTNKDQVIARAKAQPSHLRRKYRYAWNERNPEELKAMVSARRRRHKNASPCWLTKEHKQAIQQMYKSAVQLTAITGTQYVVDHIWPLMHPDVCGLHVPWNLRVITRAENLTKSNILPTQEEGLAFPPVYIDCKSI